jgi:cobalt-zinc-cadmium efflux system outer membrane protein
MEMTDRIATCARLLACLLAAAPLPAAAAAAPALDDAACTETAEPHASPTGALDLPTALAAVLIGSPDLTAFACEVRAREARSLQASRLPNPELRLDVENVAGSGDRNDDEQAETTLRLSQLIELGGKRGKRRRVADLGRDLARWDYEGRRLAVLTDATKAFVAVLAAQERVAVGAEVERLAADVLHRTETRTDAGAAAPADLAQARLAGARAAMEKRRLERDLAAARSALAAAWGAWRAEFSRAVGTLEAVAVLPAQDDLLARIDGNPDVARWAAELAERTASLRLEEAGRLPDVTVGAGGRYFSDNGDSAMVLELAVPIPVMHRNQGAIAEARHRLTKAEAERRAATLAARAAVVAAYERLAAAHEQALALRSELVPHARDAVERAEEAHEKGLFHLTQVLDVRRALYDLRGEEIDALERFHLAAADVDRLIGGTPGLPPGGGAR